MHNRHATLLCGFVGLLVVGGCQKNDHTGPAASIPAKAVSPIEAKEAFGRLTVDELAAKMADAKAGKLKLAVFDNNGLDTWKEGHLPGATWVQYDEIKPTDLPADKDTSLVFYCYNEH
jgi:hypothetical protein